MPHCNYVYNKSRTDGPKWNPDLGGEKRVTNRVRCDRFMVSLVRLMGYLGAMRITESAVESLPGIYVWDS
jgi:hypothetical protein